MLARTSSHSWTIQRLKDYKEGVGGTKLFIPTYQRGLVWDEDRRQGLIESIQKGHPIGSLLIWEKSADGGKQYHLIDGLQRTNSILTYLESPLSSFDPGWLQQDSLQEFIAGVFAYYGEGDVADEIFASQVRTPIRVWLSETKTTTQAAGFTSYAMIKTVCDALDIAVQPVLDSMEPLAGRLCDEIKSQADISKFEVPVIIYEGPETDLPNIFEKINSTGVVLTKYDKFAAAWQTSNARVSQPEIRAAIREKYQQLLDKGFEFADDYDPEDSDIYNLYEYLFGLGKYLSLEYPMLFQRSADPVDVESVAFSIATIGHGLRLSDMAILPERFDKTAGLVDPSIFQVALLDSVECFAGIMKPVYDLRFNTRAGGRLSMSIPEYQLVSYITRLLVGRFTTPDFKERPGWENEWQDVFPRSLRHHFLMDIIQQAWRGSGDTRLFNRVWSEGANGLEPSSTYTSPIDRDSWEKILDSWFEESLRSAQRDRAQIRSSDRMVLRFIYMALITVQDNADQEYEIDHIIPVERVRELIPPDDPGWPISNIANLTLLKKSDNRKKQTETLSEYAQRLSENGLNSEIESIRVLAISPLEKCGIPTGSGAVPPDKEWFIGFLRERFGRLKAALFESLYGK